MAVYQFYLEMLVIMGEFVLAFPDYLQFHAYALPFYVLYISPMFPTIFYNPEPILTNPNNPPLQVCHKCHYHPYIHICNYFDNIPQFLMLLIDLTNNIPTLLLITVQPQLQYKNMLQIPQPNNHSHYA